MRTNWQIVEPVQFDKAGQVLGFSIRALDIVHSRHINAAPRQWIELPWLPLHNLPKGADVVSVLALLSEKDIERSLTLATLAHRTLRGRRSMSEWGLQSFTAWRWFLVRLAVDKLPGPLLTVEHFDRWAVLVDRSVRRSNGRQPKRQLTVMQHGSVSADKSPRGLGFELPTRLVAVSQLRVYSEGDADVFKSEILSLQCVNRGLEVSFFSPCIAISDMRLCAGPPSILFVGHPLCEVAHCALLEALCKDRHWQLFYKPHPANPASKFIKNLPWTVVEGRSVFPLVDFLISYPSTMVYEYAIHGIPAVVHNIDVSASDILERLPEIFELVHSRYSHSEASLLGEQTGSL